MNPRAFAIAWLLMWYTGGIVTHTGGLLAGVVGLIAVSMIASDLRSGLDESEEVI